MATISPSALAAREQAALVAKNAAVLKKAVADTAAAIAASNEAMKESTTDLSDISDQITAEVDQIKLQQTLTVAEFEKETNDVKIDNNMTARDIGVLRKNDSRLNLFSALSAGDSVDVFRFKVATTGNVKMGSLIADPTDKGLFRAQIFSKSTGQVIADQDPNSGQAYTNFQKLEAGTLELAQGDYVMRLSRLGGQDPQSKNEVQYAVQLTQGVYKNDYDTIEQGTSADQDAYGFATSLGVGTDNLVSSLSSGYSFISNLPAIGTSATSKLNGVLYDSLF
nr:hypothetical protein [uncultured Dongia sp.]